MVAATFRSRQIVNLFDRSTPSVDRSSPTNDLKQHKQAASRLDALQLCGSYLIIFTRSRVNGPSISPLSSQIGHQNLEMDRNLARALQLRSHFCYVVM